VLGIFSRRADPRAGFARHFDAGVEAHLRGNAELSIEHFRECLEISPERWDLFQHMAAVHSDITGDIEESVRLLRYARRLRRRLLSPPGGPPPYCFLQAPWGSDVAGIASIEGVVKRELLQGGDSKKIVLYAPERHSTPSHALLDKMAAYITVVTNEGELPRPLDAMLSVLDDYSLCKSIDGLYKHAWHACAEITRAWETSGRGALLSFSQQELHRGSAYLRKLGVPENAWFVCLHQGPQDIAPYTSGVQLVTQRGGWVVRLGGSNDAPRPTMPRVVDHALQPDMGADLDIWLLGACRFFIGSQSELASVPPLFGTPCVLINWSPAGRRPLSSRDVYIPKLYNAGSPRRLLTFGEIMAPPLGHASRYEHAPALELAPVANTADEIREVVEEMLERFDGTPRYSEHDEVLQSAFDAVAQSNVCFGGARAGRGFLRRHSWLLLNVSNF
jgi:putative glycosyltransferase (TIGR04372 family)